MLIKECDMNITDIALSYGFSSSANFSKAFKGYFHKSPTIFRLEGKKNSRDGKDDSKHGKAFFCMNMDNDSVFELMAEVESMNVEVSVIEPMRFAYVRNLKGYSEKTISETWNKLSKWATARNLINEDTRFFGNDRDNPRITDKEKCQYDACITIPDTEKDFSGEVGLQKFEGGLYAQFFFTSLDNYVEISEAYRKLCLWIMINGYVIENRSKLTEMLSIHEPGKEAKLKIYMPVRPE